jgi:hypothetical protein
VRTGSAANQTRADGFSFHASISASHSRPGGATASRAGMIGADHSAGRLAMACIEITSTGSPPCAVAAMSSNTRKIGAPSCA